MGSWEENHWFEKLGASWVKSETGPVYEGQGETKTEGDCSRLVGGRFNKQGNLHMRLVLGSRKTSRFSHPHQNLKSLCRGLNGVQSCIQSLCIQQHITLSRLCPWNGCGNGGQNVHSRMDGEGRGASTAGSSSRVNHWSRPLDGLPQQYMENVPGTHLKQRNWLVSVTRYYHCFYDSSFWESEFSGKAGVGGNSMSILNSF